MDKFMLKSNELISLEINPNKFRIYDIDIHNYFDKDLIERSGKLGKRSSSFVRNLKNKIWCNLNFK